MGQIDLKGMIDQIMGMVKDSQAAKQNQSGGWYGGNKDEEEYWKDIRKRNTDMGLQEMKGENELAVRGATEAGATARQKLMGDTERYKSDQSLTAEKYRSDQSLAGNKYQSDRLKSDMKDSPGNILFDAITNSMDKSPQAIQALTEQHEKIFGKRETWGRQNMTGQAPAQQDAPTDWKASEKPDAPTAAPVAPVISPAVAPTVAPAAPVAPKSLEEQEKDYWRNKSATGIKIALTKSPKEAALMRARQDEINAKAKAGAEARKKMKPMFGENTI